MSNVFKLMAATRDIDSLEELNEVMSSFFDHLGFDKYAFVMVNNPTDAKANNSYVSNFPDQWEKRYTSQNYFLVDPLYKQFETRKTAFSWGWEKQKEELNLSQKKFFWEASDFKVERGLGIPIFFPNNGFSVVSLCSDHFNDNELDRYLVEKEKDLLIASLIHNQAALALTAEIKTNTDYGLTEKETEVLYWLCQNKTYEDIGSILGIKREGVSQRLRGIYRKMQACGRVDAVKKALRSGTIKL